MPSVEQDFRFGIRLVVSVSIGNKDEMWSTGGPYASKTEGDAREALQTVMKDLALVELAISVYILEYNDAVS